MRSQIYGARFVPSGWLLLITSVGAAPVPLFQAYSGLYTDNYYTISAAEMATAVNYYGYSAFGVAALIESQNVAGTVPLYRLWGPAPMTEHFYTTSANDIAWVQSWGYGMAGVAGYVYSAPAPGTVPLYRYWWYTGVWPGDAAHVMTTSTAIPAGWGYDTIVGYAYPPVTQYDAAFVSQSVPTQMAFGGPVSVSVTMKNTGWQTWDQNWALGTQSPQDNYYWCVKEGARPGTIGTNAVSVSGTVPYGATYTFNFTVQPSSCTAVGNPLTWQWQMEGPAVGYFGARTPTVSVQLSTTTTPPPTTPPPPTGASTRQGFHTVAPPGPPPTTVPVYNWPTH